MTKPRNRAPKRPHVRKPREIDPLVVAKAESYSIFKTYTLLRRTMKDQPNLAHLVAAAREDWLESVRVIRLLENSIGKRNRIRKQA